MTNKEKAKWLQINYGNYSLSWYLSDEERLNAIFNKEYNHYLSNLNDAIISHERAQLQTKLDYLKKVYKDYYHSDYDIDNSINRSETNQRAQLIRHLWVSQSVA